MLTIAAEKLSEGENTVNFNGISITVTVTPLPKQSINESENYALVISLSVVGGALVIGGAAAVTAVLLIRRKNKNGGND